MPDGGLTPAAAPQGAGLTPTLTMGERTNMFETLRDRGLSEGEIVAELSKYGSPEPVVEPEAPKDPAAEAPGHIENVLRSVQNWGVGTFGGGADIAEDRAAHGDDGLFANVIGPGLGMLSDLIETDGYTEYKRRAGEQYDNASTLGKIGLSIEQNAADVAIGAASTYLAPVVGTAANAVANYGQMYGESKDFVIKNRFGGDEAAYQKDPNAYNEVAVTAAGKAVLESAADALPFMRGPLGDATKPIVSRILTKAFAGGVTRQSIVEATTEVMQQLADITVGDPQVRDLITSGKIDEAIGVIQSKYGEDLVVAGGAGAGMGAVPGGIGEVSGQVGVNNTNKKRVDDLTAIAGEHGVAPEVLEAAIRDKTKVADVAAAAKEIPDSEAEAQKMQRVADDIHAMPDATEEERTLATTKATEARKAADAVRDKYMPKFGGKTTNEVKVERQQIETDQKAAAVKRAADIGIVPTKKDATTDDIEAAISPYEQARVEREAAEERYRQAITPKQQRKQQDRLRKARENEIETEVEARRVLEGTPPAETRRKLSYKHAVADHRSSMFTAEESDPQGTLDAANEVIEKRENAKVRAKTMATIDKNIARMETKRQSLTDPGEIANMNAQIENERAKKASTDPALEAAYQAKQSALERLGMSPEEEAQMRADAAKEASEEAEAAKVKAKAAAEAKTKSAKVKKLAGDQGETAPEVDTSEGVPVVEAEGGEAGEVAVSAASPAAPLQDDVDAASAPSATGVATDADGKIDLPEEHERYFDTTPDTVTLPMDKVIPSRARVKGVANAGRFMREAYDGTKARRGPILARDNGDGTHTVMDGNSTYANAKKAGWKNIPARLVTDAEYDQIVASKITKKTGLTATPEGVGINVRGPAEREAEVRKIAADNSVAISYTKDDSTEFEPVGAPFAADAPERKGFSYGNQPWTDLTDAVGSDAKFDDVARWIDAHGGQYEHAAIFDADGKLRGFGTVNNPNAVPFPAMIDDPSMAGGTMFHSHPVDSPFSLADIELLHEMRDTVPTSVVRLPEGRSMTMTAVPEVMAERSTEDMQRYSTNMSRWLYQNVPTHLPRISTYRVAQETALRTMDAQGVLQYSEGIDNLSAEEQEIVDGLVETALAHPSLQWREAPDVDQSRGDVGTGTEADGADRSSGQGGTGGQVRVAAAAERGASQERLTPTASPHMAADERVDPDHLNRVKKDWKKQGGEAFPAVDDVLRAADANNPILKEIGAEVSKEIGLPFYIGPIKKPASIERKLLEKPGPAGALGDIIRGGFITPTLLDSDRAMDALAAAVGRKGGKVLGEDWRVTKQGYTDRAAVVQMPDGQMAEIQFWEPHLYHAKEGADPKTGSYDDADKVAFTTGHAMYEIARDPKNPAADIAAANEGMRALYGSALTHADPSVQDFVLGRDPNLLAASENRLRQSFSNIWAVDGKRSSPGPATAQTSSGTPNKNTSPPTATTGSPSDEKKSIPAPAAKPDAQGTPTGKVAQGTTKGVAPAKTAKQIFDDAISTYQVPKTLTSIINPIHSNAVPAKKMKNNAVAAKWIEERFAATGAAPIMNFSAPLTDAQVDAIGRIMAAEATMAMAKSGNAFDWYTGAVARTIDVASARWPMLKDDAKAAEIGLGTAANARFVFTYIMATTSQNLDVSANARQTLLAYDDFIRAAAKGEYRLDPKFASGDKQKAMAKNLVKFKTLLKAVPGADVSEKLATMDEMFRAKRTVGEWVKYMKAAGLPYSPPNQTLKHVVVYGSSTLGPKIGNGFWQNLNGNFMPVTIDLWMRRTWGRMTGKSIGDMKLYPAQMQRLRSSVQTSFHQAGKQDVLETANAELAELRQRKADAEASPEYTTKKARADAVNALQREIVALEEIIPDVANMRVPEPWPKGIDDKPLEVIEYAQRIRRVWNKEYKRLGEVYKPLGLPVPPELKPTWAKAAAMIVAKQTTPIDQVGNGTQRIQIERAVARARELMAEQGVAVTPADLQAILWYPEKDLWNSLTANLEVDSDGVAMAKTSRLNETYDTAFERLFKEEAANAEQSTEGDAGRGDSGGSQPAVTDGFNADTDPSSSLGEDGSDDSGGGAGEARRSGRTANAVDPDFGWSDPDSRSGADRGRDGRAAGRRTTGGTRRLESGGLAPLEGSPTVRGHKGPIQEVVRVAEDYAESIGVDLHPQAEFVKVNTARAKRIADAYEAMPHAPQDPVVKEAYANLIKQTTAQYKALEKAGYEFFFYAPDSPYGASPAIAMEDLRLRKRMGIFPTDAGFGSGDTALNVDDNPMLADTGIKWKDEQGKPQTVYANDLFRAVHDAFGHGLEGAGFRAQGEENAWQAHIRLFTGSAKGAITSETRGQNSWLNYGPHGDKNMNAAVEDTVFADQKTGLMPEWTWTEGIAPDASGPNAAEGAPQPGVPTPLYVSRSVTDDGGLRKWATDNGLTGLLEPSDMHMTVTYSKAPVDVADAPANAKPRSAAAFGKPVQLDKALVQPLAKVGLLADHKRYREAGASHDYGDDYKPHITLKYDPTPEELAAIQKAPPFKGRVALGPEKQAKLKEGWRPATDEGGTARVANAVSLPMSARNKAARQVVVPDYLSVNVPKTSDLLGKMRDHAVHPAKSLKTALAVLEQQAFNRMSPIRRLEIATRGKLGIGAESPFKAAEMAVNDSGRAETLMYYGAAMLGKHGEFRTKPGTVGLRTIFDYAVEGAPNKGQAMTDWMSFMVARRAKDLRAKGIKVPVTDAEINAALAKSSPAFIKAADAWKAHNDANIQFLVDTGRITQQQANAMLADPHYVPFYRDSEKHADGTSPELDLASYLSDAGGKGGGHLLARDPGIKKMIGGDKQAIDNLMHTMVKNSQSMVAAGMRNHASNLTFDLLVEAGEAQVVKKGVQQGGFATKPKDAIVMWQDGKEKYVRVSEDAIPVAVAMAAMTPAQLTGVTKLAANIGSIFRQSITLSPAFMLRNAIRGAVSTGVMTSAANLKGQNNTFTGFKDAMRKGDATRAFTSLSGMGDYRFGGTDVGFGANDILIEYGLAPTTAGYRIRQALDAAEKVGTATELADRIAAFETMKKNGVREDEAAYQALTVMNYGRHGANNFLRAFLPMVPFLNARLQGLSRLTEGSLGWDGKEKSRGWAAVQLGINGAILGALGAALWAWNNLVDEERREKYKAEPQYRRLNYHIVYLGDYTLLIPKAFELGSVFNSIPEMMLDAAANDMGDEFNPGVMAILGQTFGFNAIPAAAMPVIEGAANYSFFKGQPLEGQREDKLLPRDRTEGATAASILAGQTLGVSDLTGLSPTMLEHYAQGYGGVWYSMLSSVIGAVGPELGITPPPVQGAFGTIPVISPAMAKSFGSMLKMTPLETDKFLGNFYDDVDHITQIYTSAKAAATNGDVEYAKQLLAQVPGLPEARKIVNKANYKMGKLNSAIRLTRADPKLSSSEKAKKLEPLIKERNALARQVTTVVDQIEERQGQTFAKAG